MNSAAILSLLVFISSMFTELLLAIRTNQKREERDAKLTVSPIGNTGSISARNTKSAYNTQCGEECRCSKDFPKLSDMDVPFFDVDAHIDIVFI